MTAGLLIVVIVTVALVLLGTWQILVFGPKVRWRGPWSAAVLALILLAAMWYLLHRTGRF
jgi:hypothetical protein